MTEPLVVRREIQIAAPAATVFAFLTDPENIVSWMGTEAEMEAHPGGLYLLKGVGGGARTAREHSGRSCRSTASPTVLDGRDATRCRPDRAWSRSIFSTATAARCCA